MNSRTVAPWRRRALAAAGVVGVAVAGAGLAAPGIAAAGTEALPTTFSWHTSDGDAQWDVPTGICAVDWDLQGGAGGAGVAGGSGGTGGHVATHLTVTPATEHLLIQAGAAGGDGADDGHGGMSGGQPSGGTSNETLGGGGGGASVVSAVGDTTTPILVAGGGGGGGTGDSAAAGGDGGGGTDGAGADGHAADSVPDSAAPGGPGGANPTNGDNPHAVADSTPTGAGAGGGGYDAGAPGTAGTVTGTDDQDHPIGGGGGGGANYVAEDASDQGTAVTNGTAGTAGDGVVTAHLVPCVPAAATLDQPTSTTPGEVDLAFTAGDPKGLEITGWEVSTDGGHTWSDPLQANTDNGKLHLTLSGLHEGADLTVAVRPVTGYGTADNASNAEQVTVASTAVSLPEAPTFDSAASTVAGEIDFSFTPHNNGVEVLGYDVSTDGTDWTSLDYTQGSGGLLQGSVKGLTPGDEYTVYVRASYEGKDEAPAGQSAPVVVAQVPDAPVVDQPTSPNPGEVDVTFTPGSAHGTTVSGWKVSTDGGHTWTEQAPSTSGGKKVVKLTGQSEGATLSIAVRAESEAGDGLASAPRDILVTPTPTVAPEPDAPTLDQPTSPKPGEVDLAFTPGKDNGATVTGWQVSTDGGQKWGNTQTKSAGSDGKVHLTLASQTEGATLQIAVRAVTTDGFGDVTPAQKVTVKSTTAVVIPPAPPAPTPVPDKGGTPPAATTPAAPTGVAAQGGTAQVAVSWSAPSGGGAVDHYVATLSPGGQTCSTAGLGCVIGASAGVSYTATVVAVAADGTTGPGASASLTGTVTAPAVPQSVPSTPLTLTTDKGTITSAAPGQKITVVGTGFMPYSTVDVVIYSTPIVLGTVVTDGNGDFSQEVQVPTGLEAGDHHLVASGVAPDGSQRFLRMDVTVAAAAQGGPGQLAWTGFETLPWVLGGAALVAAGGAALLLSRRRSGARA